MSKVIAVIDKPMDCQYCAFGVCKYSHPLSTNRKGFYCQLLEPQKRIVQDFECNEEVHLQNCPLREVPEKKTGEDKYYYAYGYNECIDEILKGGE